MSEIIDALPITCQTPTMAPFCKDEEKYQVVDLITKQFKEFKENKTKINDQLVKEIITINGVRFVLEDNSWGLIRASSNKPSLVVVVETLKSNKDTKNIFDFIDRTLQKTGKVGEYDQKI
jgi:phosphomannomutase/phosphoglucomutase